MQRTTRHPSRPCTCAGGVMALSLMVLLAACGGEEPELGDNAMPANLVRSALWPRSAIIPVCWENPQAATNPQAFAAVRNTIARTWEAHSGVNFVGWGKCTYTNSCSKGGCHTVGQPGIHILIARGASSYVGTQVNGRRNGMTLNLIQNTYSWEYGKGYVRYLDLEHLGAVAIHEFGHALGFSHEQNRPDAPDWCKGTRVGWDVQGDMTIGPFDPDAVVSYCGDGYDKLSQYDKLAVRTVYGDTCYDVVQATRPKTCTKWSCRGGGSYYRRINPRPCKR